MVSTKIEKKEIIGIKKLINSILGKSARGLFYSMGQIIGKNIAEEGNNGDREKFFKNVGNIISERNLVKSISFDNNLITVTGSIEVIKNNRKSTDGDKCHILRGVIVALYETFYNRKMYCEEIECESLGSDRCVFKIEKEAF